MMATILRWTTISSLGRLRNFLCERDIILLWTTLMTMKIYLQMRTIREEDSSSPNTSHYHCASHQEASKCHTLISGLTLRKISTIGRSIITVTSTKSNPHLHRLQCVVDNNTMRMTTMLKRMMRTVHRTIDIIQLKEELPIETLSRIPRTSIVIPLRDHAVSSDNITVMIAN